MNRFSTHLLLTGCLLTFISPLSGLAADLKQMSSSELYQYQQHIDPSDSAEYERARKEWQNRLSAMPESERLHYINSAKGPAHATKKKDSVEGRGMLMGAGYESQQGVGLPGGYVPWQPGGPKALEQK